MSVSHDLYLVVGAQGYTLIFSNKRRIGPFLVGQTFEFQYFWVFQKNEFSLEYEDFCGYVWGSLQLQTWTIFGGQFCLFCLYFLKIK